MKISISIGAHRFEAEYETEQEAVKAIKNFSDLVRMLGVDVTFKQLGEYGIKQAIKDKR
jgi:hypothetical protein